MSVKGSKPDSAVGRLTSGQGAHGEDWIV